MPSVLVQYSVVSGEVRSIITDYAGEDGRVYL